MQALRVLGLAILLLLGACSDDDVPPGHFDGGADDGGSDGAGDGSQPDEAGRDDRGVVSCQGDDPCVEELAGEGQHIQEMLVIGEVLTLRGANLQDVDAVYLGGISAPLIAVDATEIRCRIAPRTPSGEAAVEIKSGSLRRKFDGVTIRRLLVVAAADASELVSYDAATHTAGPIIPLPQAPERLLGVSASGRYALLESGELQVVNLPREEVAAVSGISGAEVSGWATAGEHDELLLLATTGGALLLVELSAFPDLVAQTLGAAPSAVSLLGFDAERVVGLAPAGGQQGSVWLAWPAGTDVQWAEQAGQPFIIGSGDGLQPLAADRAGKTLAFLALQGNQPQLGILTEQAGGLVGRASLVAPAAWGLAVAAGGAYVALSGATSAPALQFVATSAVADGLQQVALSGSGAAGLEAVRLPALPNLIAALVGPAGEPLVASTVEVVDLAQRARLTAAGAAALELDDLRAAVGDPVLSLLHLLRGGELRSYGITVASAEVTLDERHPRMYLPQDRDHSWLAVQP